MRICIVAFVMLICAVTLSAESNDNKHELKNLKVEIKADKYKKSRLIETNRYKEKNYISGKRSSYNKKGVAKGGIITGPYAEYSLSTKLPGGTYYVTVHYRINKDLECNDSKIIVGMDYLKSKEIQIENKLFNKVRTSFNVSFFNGKNHTVKLWLPAAGVEVHKIEITKGIITKKD